jgi:hypothetical protein
MRDASKSRRLVECRCPKASIQRATSKLATKAQPPKATASSPAGEEPIPGADGRGLAEGITSHGHRDARFIGEREAVVEHLLAVVQPGDIVITLGAGSIWQVGELLVRQLQEKG